ncbi:phage tail protein [Mucilaginibacter sp.]|uniref:phage tail protein n=1 Tax=Mucilaginibacter sp. TaxID=1882438 RepID=UPI0026039F05|nr:tail fiber protein [Mucilaginibacter sp.]MDB4922803.1 Microcystin-dependent protein [Mucilaginibacter sp.]
MQPFIGAIILFGGNFQIAGWSFCAGQLMPISENDTLFSLIGTTYGGDGQETFGLPDLQGRVAIHMGQGSGLSNRVIGEQSGTESVTLTTNQIPSHNHNALVSPNIGTTGIPVAGTYLATPYIASGPNATSLKIYNANAPDTVMSNQIIGPGPGGNQPSSIIQPVLGLTYLISLFGIFPSQN